MKTSNRVVSVVLMLALMLSLLAFAPAAAAQAAIKKITPAAEIGITLTYNRIVVAKGKTNPRLKATIEPVTFFETVLWKSENPEIAEIDPSTGLITGVQNGTTNVIAQTKTSKKTASCEVIVGIPVKTVSLDKTEESVLATKTVKLKAALSPDDASIKEVKWSSSDQSVATVSSSGSVKGIKKGTAAITALANDGSGVKGKCIVTVLQPVKSIELNITSRTVPVGAKYTVKVKTILPEDAYNKTVTWESGDPSIASIKSSGQVTGVKIGKTTITAVAQDGSGVKGKCTIYVGDQVSKITLNKTKVTFSKPGGTYKLTATVAPTTAMDKSVSWKSSNTKIAKVDKDGLVTLTAEGPGSATITVTAKDGSGVSAKCEVVSTVSVGTARVYKNTQKIYKEVGTDLYANYLWVVKNISYVRRNGHPAIPADYTREQWYAVEGMETHKGNCFTYAATFAQLAKGLGYDAQYIEGTVNGRNGGRLPHGFVIVTINGARYICDPELESVGSRNLYMQPISNPKAKYEW